MLPDTLIRKDSMRFHIRQIFSVPFYFASYLLQSMSFGFSSVFATLGYFCWNIYKACKDALENFTNISQEVASLHLVLKELEETYCRT